MGVEAFTVAVRPGRSWLYVSRLCSDSVDPVSNGLSDELGSVVRSDEGGNPTQDELVCQHIDDIGRVELSLDPDVLLTCWS